MLSLSATDGASYRAALEPLLAPCLRLRPNDIPGLAQLDASVAAMIVEPIQSMAGVIQLSQPYLEALRARTRELGIVLIFDEVQTGVGRLGAPFAARRFGVAPDLITSAKGLGAGIPVGALLLSAELAAEVREGDLGSTFGGGPIACAAVLATLAAIERRGLEERVRRVSEYARRSLRVGPVREIRGEGWLLGLVCEPPARDVYRYLLGRGILTGTSADRQVVRLLPPLIAEESDVDELARALEGWEGSPA